MKSGALGHFPPIVHLNGKRRLWNRVDKKPLENRPEERVRLRYIDYLNLECGWPASRIASEVPVPAHKGKTLRADLVCYNKQHQPDILIECKAEAVRLDHQTALQTARYNRDVGSGKICITNGIVDFWYESSESALIHLAEPPLDQISSPEQIHSERLYWEQRGFAGKSFPDDRQQWLTNVLHFFWSDRLPWTRRYLNFPQQLPRLPFNHYYRIAADSHSGFKIAVGFLSDLDGNTYLTAIFNRVNQNNSVLLCDLEKLLSGTEPDSTFYSSEEEKKVNLFDFVPSVFANSPEEVIADLPEYLTPISHK